MGRAKKKKPLMAPDQRDRGQVKGAKPSTVDPRPARGGQTGKPNGMATGPRGY